MKKFVSIGLIICLLFGWVGVLPVATAADATPAFDFEYTNNGSTITITKYKGTGSNVIIPDTIDGRPVTEIGTHAFDNSRIVLSITIPEGVTDIGTAAFIGCSNLKSIVLPKSLACIGSDAFNYCSSLTTIPMLSNVTSIGESAFSSCSSLTAITISEGVKSIGNGAFSFCPSLTAIDVDENNTDYSSENGVLYNKDKTVLHRYPEGKNGTLTISSGVTDIDDSAFFECIGLTDINVSEGNLNYNCDRGVLYNKDKRTLLKCPAGKSGEYVIPSEVTSINDSAFIYCGKLTKVTIPASVTRIGFAAFSYCSSLTDVNLPEELTFIDSWVFSGCNKLTTISIPNHVTHISSEAFFGCSSLTDVIIPDNVEGIGPNAFEATGITDITIPSSVKYIGYLAFSYCKNLSSVYFKGDAPSVGYSAFDGNAKDFKIYYLPTAQGFTSPTWQGYPADTYSQTKIVILNTPDNLIQNGNAVQTVSFIATPASGETIDPNTIEWYVNGVKQPQTGNSFHYTPADFGSYSVSVRVAGYSSSDIDTRTITVVNVNLETKDGYLFVEAEKTAFSTTNLSVVSNRQFSGGKGLSVIRGYKAQPAINDPSDIDLSFKADQAGTYNIWLRFSAVYEDSAANSIFLSTNEDYYKYTEIQGEPGIPQWGLIGSVTVSEAGNISAVRIFRCQMTGITFDAFAITNDLAAVPTDDPIPVSPSPTAPSQTTTKTVEVSNATGIIGDSAEVTVNIERNTQMAGGSFVLNYDNASLIPESYSVGTALDGATAFVNLNYQDPVTGTRQIKVNWLSSNVSNAGGELIKVKFKIQESVADHTVIPITLSALALADPDARPISCRGTPGSITAVNCLSGDVNADGKINILDAFMILKYDVGLTTLTDQQKLAADFNQDGKIDIFDAISIQKYDLGLSDSGAAKIISSNSSSYFDTASDKLSYDGDPATLWSAQGIGEWASYEFQTPQAITSVYVLLNKATERQAYFDIQASTDGINYTTVLSCVSDGKSEGELFPLSAPVTAKYFRYYGKGNSFSAWNSVNEIEFRTE